MEKTRPSQESRPSSRVNFSERLCEKKLTPLPEPVIPVVSIQSCFDTGLFIRGVNSSTYLV